MRVYDAPPPERRFTLTPLATSQNPFQDVNPIQVLDAPTITMSSPTDFAVIRPGAPAVPITATLIGDNGQPVSGVPLTFTGTGTTTTVNTNASGQAVMNMPVTGAARVVTVTVSGGNAAPASMNVQLIAAERIAPRVTSISPSGVGIDVSTQIVINFSEPVHPNTVTSANIQLRRVSATGPIVPATVFLAPDRRSVTIVPGSILAEGTRYYALANRNVTDLSGNRMAANSNFFTTRDLTPPSPPTGLRATPRVRSVALTWGRVVAADLAGYFVYRDGVRLNATPITVLRYTDTGRVTGTTHTYTVSAVDRSGNISPPSAAVSATVR